MSRVGSESINTACPLYTNNSTDTIISIMGMGKRGAHMNWSMVIPEKVAPFTGTTSRTSGPVPADSRQ